MATRIITLPDGTELPIAEEYAGPVARSRFASPVKPSFSLPEQQGRLAQAGPPSADQLVADLLAPQSRPSTSQLVAENFGPGEVVQELPVKPPGALTPEDFGVTRDFHKDVKTHDPVVERTARPMLGAGSPYAAGNPVISQAQARVDEELDAGKTADEIAAKASGEGAPHAPGLPAAPRVGGAPQMPAATKPANGGGGSWVNPLKKLESELEAGNEQLWDTRYDIAHQQAVAQDNMMRAAIEAENAKAEQLAEAAERERMMVRDSEQRAERHQSEIDRTAREAADMRVDPNRYWSSRTGFAKALARLSIVIGAGSRGENVGLKMVNEAIERDINEQQFIVEQAWRRNEQADNAFSRMLAAHGSPAAARAELKQIQLAQMEHELKRNLMTADADSRAEGLQTALSQLDLMKQEERQNALTAKKQAYLQAMQQRAAAARKSDDELDPKKRKRVIFRNGVPVGMVTGDKAETTQSKIDSIQRIRRNLAEMKQIEDETSLVGRALTPGSGAWRKWQSRQLDAMLAIKEAETLGALDKGALEVGEKLVPGPGNMNAYASIAEYGRILDEKEADILGSTVVADTPDLPTIRGAQPAGVKEVE